MVDRVTSAKRSKMMAAVKAKDTKPERAVRSALFAAGFRYRLHRRDLPGTPDIVLTSYRLVVFVHGCFWHGHECPRGRRPTSNTEFWNAKLDRNLARDNFNRVALEAAGWTVVVLWECSSEKGINQLLQELEARDQARARRRPLATELTR